MTYVSSIKYVLFGFKLKVTYVSVIKYGRITEILWLRTYVPGSIPVATIKFFYKSGNNVLGFE